MKWNAEDLSQRIFDLRLLDQRQLESVWSEIGTRDVEPEVFSDRLLNKSLLTNFQLDKVIRGDREGFYYGNYRVLYMVGAGTFARVFRAVHSKTQRVVAVKVLRRRYRNEPEQVGLFLREAHMGQKLVHPNIVRIHDVSDDVRWPYMVMEFIEGQTAREFLKIRKHIDVPTAVNLMIDVCAGLDYARKLGITHRDMKLSNVMVASNGKAKLVDFGLATMAETSDDKLLAAPNARSIDYVALERGTNVKKNDHRSDIYFAGCVFYHLLTGVAPLLETRDRLVRMNVTRFSEIKPASDIAPEIPVPILSVLNHAMCFRPENRYQEPEEFLADLKRVKFVLDKGDATEGETKAGSEGKVRDTVESGEGIGKTVMVVESSVAAQNVLREQLKKRGYRVLITNSPERAIDRFENEIRLADCAVFSAQDLGTRAVEAFNQLGQSEITRDVPTILLVDPREKELARAAQTAEHRLLMPLPLKIKSLLQTLAKLLRTSD
jgi:eukaryotic-like serine/threonine-protein kinase